MKRISLIRVLFLCLLFFYFSFFVRGQSDVDGQWSAPIGFDIVPVAVANMPDGRLLTWAASSPTGFVEVSSGPTYTEIFDPSLGVSGAPLGQFVSNLGHDMFCPGINLLPDGRIMAAGGATSDRTSIFDPGTETWSAADRMNIPRGYQGNVTLSDGSVFTLGGSWADGNSPSANGQKDAEQWSPQTGWFKLPGILGADIFTSNDLGMEARGLYRVDNHLWLWPAPNGQLFHAGPSEEMHWIDVSGNGSITSAGLRGDDTYSMKGTTVMFDQGKILKVGGAESYDSDHPAKNTAFVIDINDPGNVTVTPTPTLAFSRTMLNSVVLPNGEVLVTGGLDQAKVFTDVGARFFGEIYDPVSNTWRTVAGMNEARTYHSVSILMSDGRVFVGGGGLCDSTPGCVNHQSAEVYSPPYLFTTGGALATRPVITNAPDQADYGEGIAITTDIAVGEFSLIRFSGATHSTNNEQRRIPIATVPGTSHNLTIPGRNLLPPGYYMLFALDANGVPSVSKSIRIGNAVPLANNPNLVLDLGFEEGTGTVAADGSGNNNDATIVERDDNGTVVVPTQSYWGDGLFGDHALEMDGLEFNSNAILEVPFSTSMASIETEITVMSWVYRDEIEKNNGIFSHDYPSIFFGFHNSLYKWEFPSSTGDNPHCYAGYSPVGKWVHIAATFDGETARLYANGTEICTKSVTGTFNLEEIEQFYSSFTASGFYDKRALPVVPTGNSSGITDEIDGRLDELKVFKKALGDEEIKMFFQLGQQTGNPDVPDCPEGTIVAEFKVGDGAWTQGEYINAPEGSVVLIRAQTAGDYFITTHQVDGPTFSSVTVPEYQIDTGVDVFGLPPYDNPDRNNGLVDQSNKGQFVLTTAGGCATVITLNVGGVCEAGETEIMPEYTVNGVTGSGENELTLDEGTLLVISASPDDIDGTPLGIAITLPNGSTVEGDYAPGNISGLEHEGVYLITSDQGCSTTLTVNIVEPADGCYDIFENEDTDFPLEVGTYEAGLSSAFGTSADTNASPCAFEVVQSDSGQPWSRYRIAIDLAQHGLSPGDELFVSVDGKGIGGTARMELIVDNTANSALLSHSFGTGWGTYSGTVTVPDGASTLDLWLFSNYAGQTQGNSRYDNLVVSRIASDGPSAVIDASVLEGEVPLSVDFTGSGSTDDIGVTGYDWDFGDGASSTQADPSHQYTEIGTYQVTLTVSDIDGNTDTDTVQIKVNPVGCESLGLETEYQINADNPITGQSEVTVNVGDSLILGIIPDDTPFGITSNSANNNNKSVDLSDLELINITLNDAGLYTFSTAEGCSEILQVNVVETCPLGSFTPKAVINGIDQDATNRIFIDLGSSLVLSIFEANTNFSIKLPSGTEVIGDYVIDQITLTDEGNYVFLSDAGCTNTLDVVVVDPCSPENFTPSYNVDGITGTGAATLTVDEGGTILLSLVQGNIDYSITRPDGSINEGAINVFNITTDQAGDYTYTSADGCESVVKIDVTAVDTCPPGSIVPEYSINGVEGSGQSILTLDTDTELILGLAGGISYTTTLPDGSISNGELNLGEVSTSQTGDYIFTTPEGCTAQIRIVVNAISLNGILVYPNPIQSNGGVLTFSLKDFMNEAIFASFYDMNGRLILQNRIPENHGEEVDVDVSVLSTGTYLVEIRRTIKDEHILKKVIKLR